MPETDSGGPRSGVVPRRWALAMSLLGILYVAQGLYYARVLVPSGDMIQYLVVGTLAVKGQISPFDDRLPANRAPLPFYVLGLTQVLAGGPNLLAARWANVGFGLLTLLLTAALARRLAGNRAGILAALFLATQGVVVSGYSSEGYFAFAAFCMVGGLFVLLGGDSPPRRVLGTALIGLLFFIRSNLWPAIPFWLGYALWQARGRVERALLVGVVTMPPLLFFAWDPRHQKLLAYVPVLRRLVAPLGYVSALELDNRQAFPLAANLFEAARLVRRHEFWVLGCAVLVALVVWRRVNRRPVLWLTGNPKVVLLAVFFTYLLTLQFLIYYWNWGWVMGYFLLFAPLVPLLLGVGFDGLLGDAPPRSRTRKLLLVLLVLLLLPPLYYVRNPRLPIGEVLAKDPFRAAHISAAQLRRVVPQDAKVFFFGWNVVYYLSGLPQTYLQQAYDVSHLPGAKADDVVLRKSGFVPVSDIAYWLSEDADYAVIEPAFIETHSYRWEKFHDAVVTMQTLLDRHFDKIDTVVNEYPVSTFDIYKRKPRGGQ